jgi:hypothetical protein
LTLDDAVQTIRRSIPSLFRSSISSDELSLILKKILGPALGILLVVIAIGGWHQIGFHEGFNIGDWLINYQGGFVRRGFIGEILYRLSRMTDVSPAVLLVGLQTIIFAIYFYFSYRILQTKSNLVKYAPLLFSPFLFTFAINSQAGGYRKEILYFAVLAFLTYAQHAYTPQRFQRAFFWVLFLYPMLLLTDELGLVILPLLIGLYWNRMRPLSLRIVLYLTLFIAENAAVFLVILFHHRLPPRQVDAIISSLIRAGYDPKGSGGAIGALSQTTWSNTRDTLSSIVHAHYFLIYPLALLLCSVAYVPLLKEIKEIFRKRCLVLGLAGSAAVLLPVFIIANDWGRWLYILLVELFMAILVVDNETADNPVALPKEYPAKRVFAGSMLLMSYAIFWYLPHVLENGSDWRAVFHNVPFNRF